MSRRVHVVEAALADVDAISAWYDQREVGLGTAFLETFHARLADVAAQPLRFPRYARRTRVAVLSRFSCLVFYVIDEDWITVTGVFDGRRHPRSWSDRVRECLAIHVTTPPFGTRRGLADPSLRAEWVH